jgi:hypothetical protein
MNDFLMTIWGPQRGPYFCLSTRHGNNWREHFFTHDDFDELDDFIKEHWRDDVYFCPHALSRKRRKGDHYVATKLLWADLDKVDPRSLRERPTIAWRTSPGRYAAIWALDAPPTKALRRGFNRAIGADDGGWIVTKVLRVPGTRNRKPDYAPNPPLVKLLWDDGPTFRVRDLMKYADDEEEVETCRST